MDLIKIFSILILLLNIFFLCFFAALILKILFKKSFLFERIIRFIRGREAKLALSISLLATLGSLYLSEIRGFVPCVLCWYQKIFMYPIPVLLGVFMYKKLSEVFSYILPLSFIGMLIAAYHYYLQINPHPLIPCSAIGFSVSCSERFFNFGYITIPWMSFSAFAFVACLCFLREKVKEKE